MLHVIFSLALVCALVWPATAQESSPLAVAVEFAALADGRPLAAVTLTPAHGWYFYARDPGETGKPLEMRAEAGGAPLAVAYPPGVRKPDPLQPEQFSNVHTGATTLFVPLPARTAVPVRLRLALDLLMCSDKSCLPVAMEHLAQRPDLNNLPPAETLPWWPGYALARLQEADQDAPPASTPSALAGWDLAPRFHQDDLEVRDLWKAVGFAFLAGFILNFMPCVLPVVSLKITGLLASGGQESSLLRRRAFLRHNLYFAAGVLAYFLFLSLVLSAAGLAWGQLFQRAEVVMILTATVLALSLSLFGVFDLPVIDLKHGPGGRGDSRAAAFASGLMATLLATPCSGPFLGGVLAWVLLQPTGIVVVVFMAIGLGMASPYLLMAGFPGLARLFPRPGVWNLYLEKLVGFFLLATCIYLLQILPADRLMPALVLLWTTAVACWIWGGLTSLSDEPRRRLTVRAVAVAVAVAGLVLAVRPIRTPAHFETPSMAELRGMLGSHPVLVDFTADWCVSCKFLEQTVLTPGRLRRLQDGYGLRLVRVDLTAENPEGMALLEALGSKSIPVVAIFPAGAESRRPVVLRDLFTAATLEDALRQAL